MGVFSKGQYNDAYERAITKGTFLCAITDVREVDVAAQEGKPARSLTTVSLCLLEPAKSSTGETLDPGFVKDAFFSFYDETRGEPKLETTNRITNERAREMIVAAFQLDANCKNAKEELAARGGLPAFRGMHVGVAFDVKDNRQNITAFLPAAPLYERAAKEGRTITVPQIAQVPPQTTQATQTPATPAVA